ncbi:MAG TPA: hypothetical protein DIC48_06860 [Leuconostoc pseudomesenteroides]|nr:hypothetical protein [Leuconostoc pseudomesenteroides]
MELTIKGTPEEVKKTLQAIGGSKESFELNIHDFIESLHQTSSEKNDIKGKSLRPMTADEVRDFFKEHPSSTL